MKIALTMIEGQGTPDYLSTLKKDGHEVDYFSTGSECLREIIELKGRSQSFDLFIIDRDLPDIDGLELGKEVRSQYPDQRIILISENIQDTATRIINEFRLPIQILQKPIPSHLLLTTLYDSGIYDELRKVKSELDEVRNSHSRHTLSF